MPESKTNKQQKTSSEVSANKREHTYAHHLTLGNIVPSPRGDFFNEVKEVVDEIRKWKKTFDSSIRFRWSHKMGQANQLSKQALGNDLLGLISNQVEKEHIKTLNRDPTTYTSRLALVESILEKNDHLSPQNLRKLLIHAVIGNYNQQVKVGMGTFKEMISNRNLSLAISTQIRYLQRCINESTAELMSYQKKIYTNKDNDAYHKQTGIILDQIALLESNIGNMKYLKSFSQRLSLEQANLLKSEIVLNLAIFDTLEHQTKKASDKDIHRIQQSIYSLMQIIRQIPLLYPLAYSILERMQTWESMHHIHVPMSTFTRSQLLGTEYLILLEEFKSAPTRLKEDVLKSIFAIFGEWISFANICLAKLSTPNSDAKVQTAMTIDYCTYILRHFYAFDMFHHYLPTGYSRSRMSPLLRKGLRSLRYVTSSEQIPKLGQAIESALSQIVEE